MGCCCGKKPREKPKEEPVVEKKIEPPREEVVIEEKIIEIPKQPEVVMQPPPEVIEEVVVEEEIIIEEKPVEKEPEVVQHVPEPIEEIKEEPKVPEVIIPKDKYAFSDMDLIKGAQKLTDKEKRNLYRAVLILDSKDLKVTEVITTVTYGFILNMVKNSEQTNNNAKLICMKVIFHDEELLPSGGNKDEIKRIFTKEIEVIKRPNDKRVVKYKNHFIDDGSSLDSPALQEMGRVQILFVELEDSIQSTFQEYLNKNRGKLNDRQFLLKCQDLILGMEHLHKQKCVTRSLKPDRILVSNDENQRLKFCDFTDFNISENPKLRNYNLGVLQQNEKLQSPQIQHYLKEDKSKVKTNDKSDIWTMGALLSQLANVDQKKFDVFSSPAKNKGYIGDDQRAKLQHQKDQLLSNIISVTPNFQNIQNSFSAEPKRVSAVPDDAHINKFPRSDQVGGDCNDLLEQILEVDENERQMHKIRGRLDFLAIKYHLDAIQPRLEPDYMKGKRVDKAPDKSKMSELEKQIQSDPKNAEAHAKLASCINEYNKQDNKRALQLIRKAIELQPQNARIYNTYGGILENELLIEQAEQAYRTSIQKDPSYSLPYHNLGRLNQKVLLRQSDALENYKQAFKLDNSNQSSLFNMALVLKDQDKPVEALKYYEQYYKNNPDDSQIMNNLGVLYNQYPELRDQNNPGPTEPELFFKQAIAKNPNDVCALINKVQLLIKYENGYENNEAEIKQSLSHAERLNPAHAYTHYITGLVEMSKLNPNWLYAVDLFSKALKYNPSFSLAVYQIGLIYYEVKDVKRELSESIQLYERATIYDKNNFLAFYSLALAQEELLTTTIDQTENNRLQNKCIANYRRAIEINPYYPEALNNLGVRIKTIAQKENRLKPKSKEYDVVEMYLRQAESLAPNNLVILDNLQKLYIESKDDDLAQQSNIKGTLVGQE